MLSVLVPHTLSYVSAGLVVSAKYNSKRQRQVVKPGNFISPSAEGWAPKLF